MPSSLLAPSALTTQEQRFLLPGKHNWAQFKVLEALLRAEYAGVRLFYWDGAIELMTISPEHELIKSILEALLVAFFCQNQINAVPMGSEAQGSSAEPDLSYRLDGQVGLPDLAIEVVLSSGGVDKLTRYQKLGIAEVWFWQQDTLALYGLEAGQYVRMPSSQLLPTLDIAKLTHCVGLKNLLAAMQAFHPK
jgi:Uma2 family endonuclease